MDGGLADIQQELQAVKHALRKGAVHLGMQGETLQRYLLQLNEKENILLSRQLRHMNADPYEPLPPMPPPLPAQAPAPAATAGGHASAPETNGTVGAAAAGGGPQGSGLAGAAHVEPTPAPAGPVAAFDRENLNSVLSHLRTYEAVPVECTRALRALSSLAYADAQAVGECAGALEQIMRVLAIHLGETAVGTAAMRALCNMAFNQSVSLKRLADPSVMAIFLDAMATNTDIGVKASEAIARVVAACEAGPESPAPEAADLGGLTALFTAASGGKSSWTQVVPRLIAQLVVNEVVLVAPVAKAFVSAGRQCGPEAAAGWLSLAKQLSAPDCACPELPQPLVDEGAIGAASALMERCEADGPTQLTGIEALSSLVGSRWAGLVAFAEMGGMLRIEAAMRAHEKNEVLQTKGIRALASGIGWPQEIQTKAQYSHKRAVLLTKAAMRQHVENPELQTAALEGLSKYLEKVQCVEDITEEGGAGLIKAVMARHSTESKVIQWGRNVLGAIGEDRNWAPRAAGRE